MGIIQTLRTALLESMAAWLSKRVQGDMHHRGFTDSRDKGRAFSVESMAAESLADLLLLQFTMPVIGNNSRAQWLDRVSDSFVQTGLRPAIAEALMTGDLITVPSYNGTSVDNVLVNASSFEILGSSGDKITSAAYIVDTKKLRYGSVYTLIRYIELIPYTAPDGTRTNSMRYLTTVAKDNVIGGARLSDFSDWAENNEEEWVIPNVDRLLIGRYKNHTLNPLHPNARKGTPLCYGASAPIKEIHYLVEQMHHEFSLSEKAIIADKRLFTKRFITDSHGAEIGSKVEMPKGRERLFMDVRGDLLKNKPIEEWAPSIQVTPYLEALEKQYQEVEKCIGVSSGILSNLNDVSYQNVDNVRKATIKTQAFIASARMRAESYLQDLIYTWDTIANYYNLTPVGQYDVEYKWSDDYINTFADQQNSVLAGIGVGATDAVDYRMLVMGESPQVARERVDEIGNNTPTVMRAIE